MQEKILNEMQEKYLKSKNEQNQKLEELERLLAEKGEEEETVKEELSKCRENIDQLSRVNDGVSGGGVEFVFYSLLTSLSFFLNFS